MTKNGDKSSNSGELMTAIEIASKGLVYTSETDAAIEPFFMKSDAGDAFATLKKEFGSDATEADIEQFFDRLTTDQPWHTPLQTRTVKKFRKLRDLLRSNLTDIHVYRFGRVRIYIVVAGRDADGNLAGIKTRAVET